MEKEIRMPYSEYEALIAKIEIQDDYINNLSKLIEEKDNVLIFEQSYRDYFSPSRHSIKILKVPSEDFKIDEILREDIRGYEDLIISLKTELRGIQRENETLKSKIPWWRK